jgi:hypothetical protein
MEIQPHEAKYRAIDQYQNPRFAGSDARFGKSAITKHGLRE